MKDDDDDDATSFIFFFVVVVVVWNLSTSEGNDVLYFQKKKLLLVGFDSFPSIDQRKTCLKAPDRYCLTLHPSVEEFISFYTVK